MTVAKTWVRTVMLGAWASLGACSGASSGAHGGTQIEFHAAGTEPRPAATREAAAPTAVAVQPAARREEVGRVRPSVSVPRGTPPPSTLEVTDLVVGTGREAVSGTRPEVHYVGVAWSTGGVFDASWDRGQPFSFGLGQHQVIAGWDQGVVGMREGGRRRIVIPPALGYGARGAGGAIGPNETLVFVVDLIAVH